MKQFLYTVSLLLIGLTAMAQPKATIKEYNKVFTTYPFSDPDPIPKVGKFYPYFRFDGYTNNPVQQQWKVVELENDYLKLMILPQVGGKVWAAIEKSTGKSFVYYNHVVKFRDVAMRGPWTSGGVEANYGIVGHTPNCATPVDYTVIKREDGSVSCVIGVLDLLTRTTWRVDINLPADKAYFTTSSFWYNASPFEQPYYTWMNTGIKAESNLEFIYPGTKYLGHGGEYSDWPVNQQNGKNISFYENNDFGSYKSYHVYGKYTDFFGGYWHDEDFGMGRYSTYDDKPGKKIWIWGLSQQGMIWEKLLSDTDGQYVEVQSGRLFNQAAEQSSLTPFKNRGFSPHTTDVWTEYWFPVLQTKGFVAANNYGALNVKKEDGWIKIYFSPLQKIQDELKITISGKNIYSKKLDLKTLQLFKDSIRINADTDSLVATLGIDKLVYEAAPSANVLNRPVQTPADFGWNSAYGWYLKGKENMRMRDYAGAEEKLKLSLEKEPYFIPALVDNAVLLYRKRKYEEALQLVKKALSIDTYDPAANYYYGIINNQLGNIADAKDGFSIAAGDNGFRSAAYTELAKVFLKENNLDHAGLYARKSIDFNRYAVGAYEVLAIVNRLKQDQQEAEKVLDTLLMYDPLNHFARFEQYLWQPSEQSKAQFTGLIRNEMPQESLLELAIGYYNKGRKDEALKVLELTPRNAEVVYWQAYLKGSPLEVQQLKPDMVFPFREETAQVLESLLQQQDHWLLKYHLGLIEWHVHNLSRARELFAQCGDQPAYAPFYAARAELMKNEDETKALADLQKAAQLDKQQWRFGQSLANYYLAHGEAAKALSFSKQYYSRFPANYQLGMLYVKALMLNKDYSAANAVLQKIQILPNEGATAGRQLYRETQLMLALEAVKNTKYERALKYIAAARQWPENLGVGKPYQSQIDERLEDWLAYEVYTRLKDREMAQQVLARLQLNDHLVNENGRRFPSANDLITAWALQKSGKQEEAEKLLQDWVKKEPNNPVAQWAMNVYKGASTAPADEKIKDENYRLLQQWIMYSSLGKS